MSKIKIMVVNGVEGPSLYVNNYRVAGPKPWGGGPAIITWEIEDERFTEDLKRALEQECTHDPPSRAQEVGC